MRKASLGASWDGQGENHLKIERLKGKDKKENNV